MHPNGGMRRGSREWPSEGYSPSGTLIIIHSVHSSCLRCGQPFKLFDRMVRYDPPVILVMVPFNHRPVRWICDPVQKQGSREKRRLKAHDRLVRICSAISGDYGVSWHDQEKRSKRPGSVWRANETFFGRHRSLMLGGPR